LGSLNIGRIYKNRGNADSAWFFENDAEQIARSSGRKKYLATILYLKGAIFLMKGDTSNGLHYFYESIKEGKEQNNNDGMIQSMNALTDYYISKNKLDSALYYAREKYNKIRGMGGVSSLEYHLGTAYESLYKIYDLRHQPDSAYNYLLLSHQATDSINKMRIKSLAEFQGLTLSEQQRLQNAEKEKVIYRNKVRTNILIAGLVLLLLLAIFIYRNNLQKQKAKKIIEQAYENLKSTQAQLIHSEKMASLGELTAGIAHEIQNPLNFVNNFSDVSNELLDEMNEELDAGKIKEAKQIAADVKQNLEKITHHGKRADAIVKGMLLHSRSSTGQKETTDINALCDEYLRLSYHGLRAKDKTFNASLKTDFDPTLGNIKVVPQDLGRVVLNLLTNAFYAVEERKKKAPPGYEPAVSISTRGQADKIKIVVSDNGNGIPPAVLDKIFQPFFTTKPTGHGTGLGLSLSYDIITKGHSGELNVTTREGEGTDFIIMLPR
jgi:signal transduction histidine kinase